MAKVEKVEPEVAKPKWEPFVTITLSKREAAGVAALLARSHAGMATFGLYSDLNRELLGTNDYGNFLTIDGAAEQVEELDRRFGKL